MESKRDVRDLNLTNKGGRAVAETLANKLVEFLISVERFRRTDDGRCLGTSAEFREHFFAMNDESTATDLLFRRLTPVIRAPILSGWGIRGKQTALRDTDAEVVNVVRHAFIAGDLTNDTFEQGFAPELIIQIANPEEYWQFLRLKRANRKTLAMLFENAFKAELFDAAWFLGAYKAGAAKTDLDGIDAIAQAVPREVLLRLVSDVFKEGKASPASFLTTLGWQNITTHCPADQLQQTLLALKDRFVSIVQNTKSGSANNGRDAGPETKQSANLKKTESVPSSKTTTPAAEEGKEKPIVKTPTELSKPTSTHTATNDKTHTDPPSEEKPNSASGIDWGPYPPDVKMYEREARVLGSKEIPVAPSPIPKERETSKTVSVAPPPPKTNNAPPAEEKKTPPPPKPASLPPQATQPNLAAKSPTKK